jgi:hypothetical protein
MTMHRISWMILVGLLAGARANAAPDTSVLLSGASHLSYTYFNNEAGAAADFVFSTSYRPWPFLAVGLEAALVTPFKVGQRTVGELNLALRAAPALWLIYGDDFHWTYLKLGGGVDHQWQRDGNSETIGVMVGALGFTVAPEDLVVYFGLEIQGQWELTGGRTSRFLGLGALMGYRF